MSAELTHTVSIACSIAALALIADRLPLPAATREHITRLAPSGLVETLQALDRHGAAAGSYLTVHRLMRCHPWCAGGSDPIPEQAPRLFTALFSPTSSKKTS